MDEKDCNYDIYIAERKAAWDAKFETSQLYDKTITTLAGGAFGLSITFIRQIAPTVDPATTIFIIVAWSFFVISLLLSLISLLTSQYAIDRHIELLKIQFIDNKEVSKEKNKPSVFTAILNIVSALAFVFGAISLALFSIINL